MKTFKKFLALALVAAFAVCTVTACGCSSKKSDSLTKTEGKLVMATNAEFPPYEYVEGDEIVGIDAEIAQAIADKLGLELEIKNVKFDSIIAGVQSDKYDMGMAGMTVTDERKQSVNFSDTYATAKQVIIVKEGSSIKTVDDLSEKTKIGVQQGTTGEIYAADDYGDDAVTKYNSGADAVAALSAGKIDCVIIDVEPAKAFVKANSGLTILETEYVEEEYAICFNKNNTELQKKVNEALKELKEDGTIDKIVAKYITAE